MGGRNMKHVLSHILTLTCLILLSVPSFAGDVRHRFLALDWDRPQLLYVDEYNPELNKIITLPTRSRDMQVIEKNRLLLSMDSGYREYNMTNWTIVRKFSNPRYKGVNGIRRLADGRTILSVWAAGKITFAVLDAENRELKTVVVKEEGDGYRRFRISRKGNLLFGNGAEIVELSLADGVVRKIKVPACSPVWQVAEMEDGSLLATGGHKPVLVKLGPKGKQLYKYPSSAAPAECRFAYFAGFHAMSKGNVVVANHSGVPQIAEFSPDGELAWSWFDKEMAGSIFSVIVLDGRGND